MSERPLFWSDQLAFAATKKFSEKDEYICASGISPSGTVHIGNFREIITTDFVVKSLKNMDEETRFIYSWDDYDRFRKVPENVPDEWEQYIGMPLSEVPSPDEEHDSYAEYFISQLENELEDMHMDIEFIRQSKKFKNGDYTELIKQAMNNREAIREILNQYRTEPLQKDWYPLRVYCNECKKDFTEVKEYNGEYTVKYYCEECEEDKELNFKETPRVKPPWRVDWPMRWKYEDVSFEPGGKDHSAAGSSRDTGKEISKKVFNQEPPIYQMYDFVKPKGSDKKISSSSGENSLTLSDLKEIYPPEMVRFLFSENKPKSELTLAFDEEIIQRYNKFDKIEKTYYNPNRIDNDRQREHWKRVYEIAVVETPEEQPVRIPFKHASFVAQTIPQEEWEDKAIISLKRTGHIEKENLTQENIEQVTERLQKAKNWARNHAPEEYIYKINYDPEGQELSEDEKESLKQLKKVLENVEEPDKDTLDSKVFDAKDNSPLDAGEFFEISYQTLLNRDQGPRLSTLILAIGIQDTIEIIEKKLD